MFNPDAMERACEREEQAAADDLNAGRIDQKQYNARIRDIQRDYREAADESANDAYERERERW